MNEKKAREHLSKYDKETIIDLYLQKCYELDIAKEELDKAIVPKFKMGQEVWYYHIGRNKTYSGVVEDIQWKPVNGIYYRIPNLQRSYFWLREDEMFATEEEARAKLKELQNEQR